MNLYNINTILTREARIQGRSILYKILVCLVLGGITYIIMAYQGNFPSVPWQRIAMPSFIPWVSTTLLNIVQNLFIIFMTSGFYKRLTAESIEVRPAENYEWLIGKVLGVIKVLVLLDLASIGTTSIVHVLLTDSPFHIGIYFFYFVTLTIPSILFYTGLTLFLSFSTRQKSITVLVSCVFYLFTSGIFHPYWNGTSDVLAISIPNVFSNTTGHINLGNYLLHQGAFAIIGIGLLWLAAARFNRIPNRTRMPRRAALTGSLITITGICLLASYQIHFINESHKRESYINIFSRYQKIPPLQIPKHEIHFSREGSSMTTTSEITLKNPNKQKTDTILLFLNPGLKISSLQENGEEIPFRQEGQITLVFHPLNPEQEINLKIRYTGKIDESIAYLDIPDKLFYKPKDNPFLPFVLGKRFAMIQKNFIYLTPDVMWYPSALPPVDPLAPFCTGKDFTRFTLTVKEQGKLVFLSQGKEEKAAKGIIFRNEEPLTGISLCAGKFNRKTISMGKFNAYLYHLEEQPFFYNDLKLANSGLIIEKYNELLSIGVINDNSPDKLMLVETPLAFCSYFRPWKKSSDFAQPEILFCPERGATFDLDLKKTKKTFQKNLYTNNEKELQNHLLSLPIYPLMGEKFAHSNKKTQVYIWEKNKYNIYPILVKDTCYSRSNEFPILGLIVNNILEEEPFFSSTTYERYPDVSTIQAFRYLEKHSLKEALEDKKLPEDILTKIITLKQRECLHYLASLTRRDQVIDLIRETCTKPYRVAFFEEFIKKFKERFNTDILPFSRRWYTGKGLSAVIVQETKVAKLDGDKLGRYTAHVKLYNPTDVDAIVYVSFGDENREKKTSPFSSIKYLVIPARSCKLVKITNDNRYNVYIHMGISQNLPNQEQLPPTRFFTSDTTSGIFDREPDEIIPNPDEITVDNEDEGFSIIEPARSLYSLFEKEFDRYYEWPYFAVKWAKHYDFMYYGKIKKSIYYKVGGKGNYKARWETSIPEPGEYEIFAYTTLIYTNNGLSNYLSKGTLHYTIEQGEEKHEVTIDASDRMSFIYRWFNLGSYTLKAGKTSVTLDDRGAVNQYIVADAVKWVKKKPSTNK